MTDIRPEVKQGQQYTRRLRRAEPSPKVIIVTGGIDTHVNGRIPAWPCPDGLPVSVRVRKRCRRKVKAMAIIKPITIGTLMDMSPSMTVLEE